jgi:hypothetical protein
VLQLNYCRADGSGQEPVIIADGVVVGVPASTRRTGPADVQPLLGAPVELAVAELGAVQSVAMSATGPTLQFATAELQVSQGFVVGIRRH